MHWLLYDRYSCSTILSYFLYHLKHCRKSPKCLISLNSILKYVRPSIVHCKYCAAWFIWMGNTFSQQHITLIAHIQMHFLCFTISFSPSHLLLLLGMAKSVCIIWIESVGYTYIVCIFLLKSFVMVYSVYHHPFSTHAHTCTHTHILHAFVWLSEEYFSRELERRRPLLAIRYTCV